MKGPNRPLGHRTGGHLGHEFAKESCFPPKLQYFPFSRPADSLPMKLVLRT